MKNLQMSKILASAQTRADAYNTAHKRQFKAWERRGNILWVFSSPKKRKVDSYFPYRKFGGGQ